MDKMEKAAGSEVDNFDICEKDHQEAFVGWKRSGCSVHTLQLVVKLHQKCALAKVNKSCKASECLIQLARKKLVKKLPNPMGFIISSHYVECLK